MIDFQILSILQKDATLPVKDIAKKVGLSNTPCWTRIQKLQELGVIKRKTAVLDPEKLGFNNRVFIFIKTNQHKKEWADKFKKYILNQRQVIGLYRISGTFDYLINVLAKDIGDFDTQEIFRDNDRDVKGIIAQSRVRLRKYYDSSTDETFAIPEMATYGAHPPGFVEAVRKWSWNEQKDIFIDEGPPEEERQVSFPREQDIIRYGGSWEDTKDGELFDEMNESLSIQDQELKLENLKQ